uniref:Uncharacterized protein n=1 Tax=Kalanchoe fedtschenkoi TaxID=63787 RepID=A0A7N0ZYY9_KALFE
MMLLSCDSVSYYLAAGSSLDHRQINSSMWSVQPQNLSFSRYGNDHKASMTSKSEEAGFRTKDQAPRPSVSPVPIQQPLQGTAIGQGPPLVNNHNEISKIVHKMLQKQFPERPTWTPPSRDYMNKGVMCQVCHFPVNDVESVLLCDACEHAYHFRCLQSSNQKVVPRGEWHCPKCLQLSNGKPLPPKYGRVTRNVSASKVPSKVTGFQNSSEQKANTQKVRTGDPQAGNTGSVDCGTRISDRRAPQGSKNLPILRSMTAKSGATCGPLGVSSDVTSAQDLQDSSLQSQSMPETEQKPVVKLSDTINDIPVHEQTASGLPTGKSDTLTNMTDSKSGTNDLPMSDTPTQLSDPDANASSSQECSTNILKPETASSLLDSNTHMFDSAPFHDSSNEASAAKLTDVMSEISSHKPDTSDLSKPEHADELSNSNVAVAIAEPGTNAICSPQPIANLSGPVKDQSNGEPVSKNMLEVIAKGVNDSAEVQQVTNHNRELKMSHVGEIKENGITCSVTTDPDLENTNSTKELQPIVESQNGSQSSDDSLQSVQWQGDLLKAVDDKHYYRSCCVDGVTYQLHEHALFRFDEKLVPSRIQAMWEDIRSGEKWLLVSRCYFPCDLPEAVELNHVPQENEVYESDCASTIMAGLIKGPCKVLTPDEFRKESEKNTLLEVESGACEAQWPVHVCNWCYKKSEGILQMTNK